MKRKPTADRIEFDNETYQITARISTPGSSEGAVVDCDRDGRALQTALREVASSGERRPTPPLLLGAMLDSFESLESRPLAIEFRATPLLH